MEANFVYIDDLNLIFFTNSANLFNLFSELADTGKCAVVLFDSQHYMYKEKNSQALLEIQSILKHVGFSFVKSVNGGEIVIYVKGK